jgi:hypothetical protein
LINVDFLIFRSPSEILKSADTKSRIPAESYRVKLGATQKVLAAPTMEK